MGTLALGGVVKPITNNNAGSTRDTNGVWIRRSVRVPTAVRDVRMLRACGAPLEVRGGVSTRTGHAAAVVLAVEKR